MARAGGPTAAALATIGVVYLGDELGKVRRGGEDELGRARSWRGSGRAWTRLVDWEWASYAVRMCTCSAHGRECMWHVVVLMRLSCG